MNGFEEQARSAAADAHESVTRLAVPELGGGPASGGRRLVLAGAAVIALLVAGVFVFRGDDSSNLDVVAEPEQPATDDDADDGSTDDGPGEAAELAYFVPAFDPEWEFFAREDGRPDSPDIRLTLFGTGTDDDWIADGFLVIAATEDQEAGGFDEDVIEVRGREGFITQDLTPGSNGIEWQETDGVGIQVASDVMSIDELIAFAEGFEIDGLLVTPTAPPPSDMVLLVDGFDRDRFLELTGGWAIAASSADETEFVSLTGARGSDDGLLITRIVNAAQQPVELRGTTGYLSVDERFNAVVWLEGGMILTLYASPGTDVVALAEQVEPITPTEWQALVDGSINPEDGFGGDDTSDDFFSEAFGETLETGELNVPPGDWTLAFDDEVICIELAEASLLTSACLPLGQTDSVSLGHQPGGTEQAGHLFGTAEPGPAGVALITNQREVFMTLHPLPSGEVGFGTALEADEIGLELLFVDTGGNVVLDVDIDLPADYPTIQPPVSDYPTVLPTIPPPFEYPRIGPLEQGLVARGEFETDGFILERNVEGDLCLEIWSLEIDFVDATCSPYDVLFLGDADGDVFIVGLAPECTTQVLFFTDDEQERSTTLFEGERGEVVFVANPADLPFAFQANGESEAFYTTGVDIPAWNVEQVCTAQF